MFRNREDAGLQLAQQMKGRALHDPLVLAIPRGGVPIGVVLARQLGADLDIVLSRKLRAPGQPELAVGAISEDGRTFLNEHGRRLVPQFNDYLMDERQHQLAEIAHRKALVRSVQPKASIADRTVIVTDDGIATGSTLLAALNTVRLQNPRELIVAVPVASPDRLDVIREHCDALYCLRSPPDFRAIGCYYEDFQAIADEEVVRLLREFAFDKRAAQAPNTN
jgi:putative phosphoribosyl transferase